MKKLFLYIFLSFLWCNIGSAERISFYNIKIGDKITDHFTFNQIDQNYVTGEKNSKGEIVYGKDKIYSYIAIVRDNEIFSEDFSQAGIQIYYKNKTDKIVSIGKVELTSNLNKCIIERDQDALNYKKKNRISTLLNEPKDFHQFPDGMEDHFISFEG